MPERLRARMVLHGVVVILLGLLAGFPHALVLVGGLVGEERAWRMAHLEGVLNGMLVVAVAAVAPAFSLSPRQHALMAWSLVAAGYGNAIASTLGAWTGQRGLALAGSLANNTVFILFFAAIAALGAARAARPR